MYNKFCENCKKEFTAKNSQARFCGARCTKIIYHIKRSQEDVIASKPTKEIEVVSEFYDLIKKHKKKHYGAILERINQVRQLTKLETQILVTKIRAVKNG